MVTARHLISIFAALALSGCNDTSDPGLDGRARNLQEFEERVEILRGRLDIPGLGLAISSGNQIAWARGLGYADIEQNIPARPSTEFHIASLTKGFAGVILVKLVSEGEGCTGFTELLLLNDGTVFCSLKKRVFRL
jgi:CubicO group peptidase (beta-lactamase class C family)